MGEFSSIMKKINTFICHKQNGEIILALIVAAVLSFIFLLNSPLHIWRCAASSTDSSVFKTIALMMDKGYMPYRDSFDHKGPLLYVINYLGLKIAYYRGVWVFEFSFMTITLFMLYKIARLKTGILSSILVALTAATMLFKYFEAGNLTEEYAMPFIAIGIYIFLDYLLNTKISWYRLVISGASMGAVCLLRPNMIAVWLVFCSAIFFKTIAEKDWKQLGRFVLWFIVGVVLMVTPFAVWLAANGALQACIEDYIVFNMQYTSAEGGRASLGAKWTSFFTFASNTIYIFALLGIIYNLKKKLFVDFTYAAYLIISLVLLCLSGMTYPHYGMVLVPAVVYPLALIIENIEKLSDQEASNIIKMLIATYIMAMIIVPQSLGTINSIPSNYSNRHKVKFDDTIKQVCDKVTELTSEDDAISVYGNWDIVYVITHRKHATKYSYQVPIGSVMPEILDEYMKQLEEELPPVIVLYRNDSNIRDFLKENAYEKVYPDEDEEEKIDDNNKRWVYYRAQQ